MRIQLRINLEVNESAENPVGALQNGLAGFLGISPDSIKIMSVKKRSKKVTIELPDYSAKKLLCITEKGVSELNSLVNPLIIIDIQKKLRWHEQMRSEEHTSELQSR